MSLFNWTKKEDPRETIDMTVSKDLSEELFAFKTQKQADGHSNEHGRYCERCGFSHLSIHAENCRR